MPYYDHEYRMKNYSNNVFLKVTVFYLDLSKYKHIKTLCRCCSHSLLKESLILMNFNFSAYSHINDLNYT